MLMTRWDCRLPNASWGGAVGLHSNAAQQVCPTTAVKIEPNPVVPGRDVRLEWVCDAKEDTRSGTITTKTFAIVLGFPIEIGKQEDDYCDEIKCPAPAGRRIIDTQFGVPADQGRASLRMDTVIESEGKEVSCTRVFVSIGLTNFSLPPVEVPRGTYSIV